MDYKSHYDRLVDRARRRILSTEYVENHHILPRCMGGNNERSNLVKLFPEEHFIAHQLLVKIYPHQPKLIFALLKMSGARNNNKAYGWIKRKLSTLMKHNTHNKGRVHNDDTKRKISAARKNLPPTTKGKVRAFNILTREQKCFDNIQLIPEGWKRGIPPENRTKSAQSIERTSNFHRGRKRTATTCERMRNAVRRKRITVQCDKCERHITPQNIKRHKEKTHGQVY